MSSVPACCRSPWGWIAAAVVALVIGAVTWMNHQAIDPIALRREGADLLTRGRTAEAIGTFERALVERDEAATRILLAGAWKTLGRSEEASREYKRALTLEPQNAVAWFNFGNLLRVDLRDTRSALEAYRKASECDPNMGEAQFSLGAMLIETGDYETAVAALKSALQVAPPDAPWRADAETALNLARLRALEAQGKLPPPRK